MTSARPWGQRLRLINGYSDMVREIFEKITQSPTHRMFGPSAGAFSEGALKNCQCFSSRFYGSASSHKGLGMFRARVRAQRDEEHLTRPQFGSAPPGICQNLDPLTLAASSSLIRACNFGTCTRDLTKHLPKLGHPFCACILGVQSCRVYRASGGRLALQLWQQEQFGEKW